MAKEHLRKLTEEDRKKGQTSRSLKKAQAARLNPIKHGKHVKHKENSDKSLLQIKLEKAFKSDGVRNSEELTKHLLSSLALTAQQLDQETTFQNSGAYTRLVIDVYKALKEELTNSSNIAEETLLIEATATVLQEEGQEALILKIYDRTRKLQEMGLK